MRRTSRGRDLPGFGIHSWDDRPKQCQEKVPVLPDDTPESLHARIQKVEHQLYPAVVAGILTEITGGISL
ncbi:MAG: hypothetical protein ACKO2G_08015, partial [Verrucomicrobiales bacterium]